MKFDKKQATKPKRAYIPPGVYQVRLTGANEYDILQKSAEDNPKGTTLCLMLRFDDVEGRPLLPHDVPVTRQWQIGQILEAVMDEVPDLADIDPADIVGAKVVVQVADWTPPEREEALTVVKRYFPKGTTRDEAEAILKAPKKKAKAASSRPPSKIAGATRRPKWETDDADADAPF